MLKFILLLISFNTYALEGLKVGDKAPNLTLKDTAGMEFNIAQLKKPTALVFYRGSWCPYCMTQLKSIEAQVMGKLPKGAQLLAISVDRLKIAKKMKAKNKFSFSVISDPKATSLKEFKIVNQLDDDLVKKYKSSYKNRC